MGKVFELIADSALVAEDAAQYTECHVCSRPGVPVYPAQGELIRPDGTVDETYDIYVACEECLKAGRVRHVDEWATDPVIEQFARDTEREKALLRATPRCPTYVQPTDWPLCCGALTEYTGEPSVEQARALDRSGQFWHHGPQRFEVPAAELVPSENLPVLGGVSSFRCRNCAKQYWICSYS